MDRSTDTKYILLLCDFVMDTLLVKMLPVMKKHTGLDLIPTYSYTRAYKKGDILKRHKDRPVVKYLVH